MGAISRAQRGARLRDSGCRSVVVLAFSLRERRPPWAVSAALSVLSPLRARLPRLRDAAGLDLPSPLWTSLRRFVVAWPSLRRFEVDLVRSFFRPFFLSFFLQTTIMAVTYAGGVVLGADSRTSTGSYVANRTTDKLTALAENVYVCRSGSAADTQNVSRYISQALEEHSIDLGRPPRVRTAASLARAIVYPNKDRLQAGLIVAGWDEAEGGCVFSLPLGGTELKVPFALGGSGSAYITGLVDRLWKPNMTKEEAVAFVQKCVAHAMARDGSSGGCVRTVAIDATGVQRTFTPNDEIPPAFGELAPPRKASAQTQVGA